MSMTFKEISLFGTYIGKDYAEDIFRLLSNYCNISASEAASRLNMHIRTVQDFLEAMTSLEIIEREEVYEGKRPYNRYSLKKHEILLKLDLNDVFKKKEADKNQLFKIRERKNSGAKFTTGRGGHYFSYIAVWTGRGREKRERKINLTVAQGKFLFNLPFPSADFMSVDKIIDKAEVKMNHLSEILDIVDVLKELKVIEVEK